MVVLANLYVRQQDYPEYNLFIPITSAKQTTFEHFNDIYSKLMDLLDDKSFQINMYFQNLHESKMSANNLINYLLFLITSTVITIMRSLLNLFCTFKPSFIR